LKNTLLVILDITQYQRNLAKVASTQCLNVAYILQSMTWSNLKSMTQSKSSSSKEVAIFDLEQILLLQSSHIEHGEDIFNRFEKEFLK
jgi:hypothetical protein